jgi:hypothetical protein
VGPWLGEICIPFYPYEDMHTLSLKSVFYLSILLVALVAGMFLGFLTLDALDLRIKMQAATGKGVVQCQDTQIQHKLF